MLHIVESRKSTQELARNFPAAASRHISRETLEHVADAILDALGVRCDNR